MDRYTKTILTVIAISLLWISAHVGDLMPSAFAGNGNTRIEIAGVSVNGRRALPVIISGELTCK